MRTGALLGGLVSLALAVPADAGPRAAPTVSGTGGYAAVVVLPRPVPAESVKVAYTFGRPGGAYLARLDGPITARPVWSRYYDGHAEGGSPIAHMQGTAEVLPAGRYAVHLLGTGPVSVDLDTGSRGGSVRAARRFDQHVGVRDVELSQVAPARWQGGVYDGLRPSYVTVAGIHLEGRELVGDSDFCELPRGHETCAEASPEREVLPRWLTPTASTGTGRHEVRFMDRRWGDRTVVSFDGVTRPSRLQRTLLVFRPITG